MRRSEDECTTNTIRDCGLSGPQSRLGLVRANPPPSSEFKLKKCLQLCGGWIAARIVCQCEDTSLSAALLPLDDEHGLKPAMVPNSHHITV